MHAEWADRTAFAEVAEALGVRTDMVLAVSSDGIAIFTPEGEDEFSIAELGRDGDGVPVVVSVTPLPGMAEQIERNIEAALAELEEL